MYLVAYNCILSFQPGTKWFMAQGHWSNVLWSFPRKQIKIKNLERFTRGKKSRQRKLN